MEDVNHNKGVLRQKRNISKKNVANRKEFIETNELTAYNKCMANELDDDKPKDLFDEKWLIAASHGACDSFGGMEYTRVKREWNEVGRPKNISLFIVLRTDVCLIFNEEPEDKQLKNWSCTEWKKKLFNEQ